MNKHLQPEGLSYEAGGDWWNKNFLWILAEEIGFDALRERVQAPARGAAHRAVLRLLHRAPVQAARLRRAPERDHYLELLIEALGGEAVEYAGARKCCGFPVITMNRTTSLRQAGRHLADAIDAGADCLVTPCPLCHLNLDLQQPGRASSWSATSASRCCTCRRWSASPSGSSRRSSAWASTSCSTERRAAQGRRARGRLTPRQYVLARNG